MKTVGRLLELWTELPYQSRSLLIDLAEALAESNTASSSTRKTVYVPKYEVSTPTVAVPEVHTNRCPECRLEIADSAHRFCGDCGCPLPSWRNS